VDDGGTPEAQPQDPATPPQPEETPPTPQQATRLDRPEHGPERAPAATAPLDMPEDPTGSAPRRGVLGRLMGRETARTETRRALDDDMHERLEDLLITADMGVETALRVTANMAEGRMGKRLSSREIKALLAQEIARIMDPVARPMPLYAKRPQVVLVVGVNGSGKTTTIGKLASQFRNAGKSVVIAAGDTFRAAAVEQLQVWGDRAGVPVLKDTYRGEKLVRRGQAYYGGHGANSSNARYSASDFEGVLGSPGPFPIGHALHDASELVYERHAESVHGSAHD